jgi:hypothetical protein
VTRPSVSVRLGITNGQVSYPRSGSRGLQPCDTTDRMACEQRSIMQKPETEERAVPLAFGKKEPAQCGTASGRTSPQRDAYTMTVTEVAKENRDED